ncbi:MAG TPA: GNAT family N-acetyltransferase [Candidatus Hydrogenedentes bacterium]|nr:GNAT family N-acetyltransferase [Candidatus Hydrogenedentota bacterium]
MRLMGHTISAVAVAPVAVVPGLQGKGIGSKLLREGHSIAQGEGFSLAFLNGHPEYYQRMGYQSCFGFAKIAIDVAKLPPPSQRLQPMPVHPSDIPWLVECCAAEWADVDFFWQRGTNLSEWTLCGTNALIWWTEFGQRAAYTLGWPGGRKWQMVLAEDPMLARAVIAQVRPTSLQQHPAGWLVRHALAPEWAHATVERHPAAMARELRHGVLRPYLKALEAGERLPGFCNWPLPFMAC